MKILLRATKEQEESLLKNLQLEVEHFNDLEEVQKFPGSIVFDFEAEEKS